MDRKKRLAIQISIGSILVALLLWVAHSAGKSMEGQASRNAAEIKALSEKVSEGYAKLDEPGRKLRQLSMDKLVEAGLLEKSSRAVQGVRSDRYGAKRKLELELAVVQCALAGKGIEIKRKGQQPQAPIESVSCAS